MEEVLRALTGRAIEAKGQGPLAGVKVLEIASIGPGPYAGMLLSDLGAEVTRVERPGSLAAADPSLRGRRSLSLDLKCTGATDVLMKLIERSDVLIEGFRPGVAERLGFGPDRCLERNPRLIFGRITGWGQQGPLAKRAGHDINYLALSGFLHQVGPRGGKPVPPINAVADYGAGGMMLAFGVVAALYERERSGLGQVVDAAMVDGVASFLAAVFALQAQNLWRDAPGENFLTGAAHFYDTYETRDNKWVAIGAIEPQFHVELLTRLGLDLTEFAVGEGIPSGDRYEEYLDQIWPSLKERLASAIRQHTRAELETLFEDSDACLTPVLSLKEAVEHPHHVARRTFINVNGQVQNAPAPRFSRSSTGTPTGPGKPGADTERVLSELGYSDAAVAALRAAGALGK